MARCFQRALTGKCKDWTESCPVACGVCEVCATHPQHEEYLMMRQLASASAATIETAAMVQGDTSPPKETIMPSSSSSLCHGECCSRALHRNRTCAYFNLLFRDRGFYYLSDEVGNASQTLTDSYSVFINLHFRNGHVGPARHFNRAVGHRSLFAPPVLPPSAAHGAVKVIKTPIYVGSDLHHNPAHNMFDYVFPAFLSLLRLRDLREKQAMHNGGDASANALSSSDDFIYLVYEQTDRVGTLHRLTTGEVATVGIEGTRLPQMALEFARTVCGRVMWLPELVSMCGVGGCLVRTAFAGAGHIGLTMVDERNLVGGSQFDRALWRYRQRIMQRFKILSTPHVRAGGAGNVPSAPPYVILIETKRAFNLLEVREAVLRQAPTPQGLYAAPIVEVIRWHEHSLTAQLQLLQRVAVYASSVGTGMMNSFFLPAGAVCIHLGWRFEPSWGSVKSVLMVHYMDSSIPASQDYVRVLYYPSYEPSELRNHTCVTLRPEKASRPGCFTHSHQTAKARVHYIYADPCAPSVQASKLIHEALALHARGFSIPVAIDENLNDYDRAYFALVQATGGKAHMARTDDGPPSSNLWQCAGHVRHRDQLAGTHKKLFCVDFQLKPIPVCAMRRQPTS